MIFSPQLFHCAFIHAFANNIYLFLMCQISGFFIFSATQNKTKICAMRKKFVKMFEDI